MKYEVASLCSTIDAFYARFRVFCVGFIVTVLLFIDLISFFLPHTSKYSVFGVRCFIENVVPKWKIIGIVDRTLLGHAGIRDGYQP